MGCKLHDAGFHNIVVITTRSIIENNIRDIVWYIVSKQVQMLLFFISIFYNLCPMSHRLRAPLMLLTRAWPQTRHWDTIRYRRQALAFYSSQNMKTTLLAKFQYLAETYINLRFLLPKVLQFSCCMLRTFSYILFLEQLVHWTTISGTVEVSQYLGHPSFQQAIIPNSVYHLNQNLAGRKWSRSLFSTRSICTMSDRIRSDLPSLYRI